MKDQEKQTGRRILQSKAMVFISLSSSQIYLILHKIE